jgi:hypothetical protein
MSTGKRVRARATRTLRIDDQQLARVLVLIAEDIAQRRGDIDTDEVREEDGGTDNVSIQDTTPRSADALAA